MRSRSRSMRISLWRFLHDELAGTTVENGVMLALVTVMVMSAVRTLGTRSQNSVDATAQSMAASGGSSSGASSSSASESSSSTSGEEASSGESSSSRGRSGSSKGVPGGRTSGGRSGS